MATKSKQREWLKCHRLNKGLTQKDVAAKAKIARTTYASIEQGERNAGVQTAKSIAEVLDFNWTLFFDDQVRISSNERNAVHSA
ncbi:MULTISPECIES: helix-turn-helix transcriptional regulator [Bacillus]|uniref:helix-turn-helix transcriptional regulator n=1 Tax=Bacillus TaxID=1386 RepID=UPI0004E2FBA5|nr:helix-turn-helix transcriptional regulator [Bacillus subtilis]KFC31119.1 XRE family transcriptional regulator [Bacillus subtilis]MBO3634403.1 helix-turn-helix transcriptional regulator [Bacillus subtilis]MBO3765792.1 helix-turn-helix transcriptional regulator [Bacillus subtilis]MCY8983597.1 helix-turn-helix domain-containing protein [Bacillus subtilis]MEC0365189.1 helix-turn-helix transcriptional regulator [Bacillus subtilis]